MTDESATDTAKPMHGSNGVLGAKRYCRGCSRWVELVEWTDHEDHYP